jgi:hypothetical protein
VWPACPNVERIIYLASFQLDKGESILGLVGGEAPPLWNVDGDTVTAVDPIPAFYHDVPIDLVGQQHLSDLG